MKTEIKEFCQEYSQALGPLSEKVKQTLSDLPMEGEDAGQRLGEWKRRLREVAHRSEAVYGKIAEQQAYLLIFGPLKSGKSTLMNAISGSYVSEVSSLPAYPALVHVRHGDKVSYQATTYAGEKMEFENAAAMARAVQDKHEELARRIRERELAGESFDPQAHFPEAIRRMDVQMPAPALADSGSVLVDTPGLYTRMRFGYDAMTRDFRDTASCAVFVVKSDNLFFEKVFEEFNELLGHFSRIFLVVNIDSSKRDLSADGTLEPSLESREPSAIIEAFESLAMSAPLREAYKEGRLNVYAIDLLKAASQQLQGKAREAGEDDDASSEEEAPEASFSSFLQDLTEYLNSNDYLREFMCDSLRAGEGVSDEIGSVAGEEAPSLLRAEAGAWKRRLDQAKERRDALEVLNTIDWDAAFEEARAEKDRLLEEFAVMDRGKLGEELSDSLERWLDTDDTLRALRDDYLNKLVERETAEDGKVLLERLRALLEKHTGGARLSPRESRALDQAGLQLDKIASDLSRQLSENNPPAVPRFELQSEDVPMKRSFADWLLFRKRKSMGEGVFGSEGTTFVPSKKKRRRISGKHLDALRERVKAFPQEELPRAQKEHVNRLVDDYVERLKQTAIQRRTQLEKELNRLCADCEAALKSNRKMQEVFDQLADANRSFGSKVEELKERFDVVAELETSADAEEEEAEKGVTGPNGVAMDGGQDESLAIDPKQLENLREQVNRAEEETFAPRR